MFRFCSQDVIDLRACPVFEWKSEADGFSDCDM